MEDGTKKSPTVLEKTVCRGRIGEFSSEQNFWVAALVSVGSWEFELRFRKKLRSFPPSL